MKNLKVWQKLAVMGAVFLVPFAAVTYKMVSSIEALGIDVARLEIQGLDFYTPAMSLLKNLQLHRDIADAPSGGDLSLRQSQSAVRADLQRDIDALDDIDRRLGGTLQTSEQWKKVRAECAGLLSGAGAQRSDDRFAQHSKAIADLIALITDTAHISNLTRDPDVDRRRLVDVLISEGPELSEALARARGYGLGAAAGGARTAEQVERLSRDVVVVELRGATIDESMAKVFQANAEFKSKLEARTTAASDSVIEATGAIARLAMNGSAQAQPAAYFGALTEAVDATFALEGQIAASLRKSLDVRITALWRDLMVTLGWSLLGLLLVTIVAVLIIRDITVTLGRVVHVANRIALGDLDMTIDAKPRNDEIGVLTAAFAGMITALKALVAEVQRSGIQVSTSVNQIAAISKQQQATASEIAATTTQISTTSKEIAATSKELARTMNDVAGVADESATLAGSGQAGVSRMEATMRHVMEAAASINEKLAILNEKAGGITQVVTTITKVADQTNLLSLNAAIEAEKAGEYGRGFAVVATEIRRLADQTAVATYDIEQMVKEIQSAVSAGVMGMDKFSDEVRRGREEVQQVGDQLSQIIGQVQALAPQFEAVKDSMEAQALGAEQITEALAQLGDTVHQTVVSLRESNHAIDGLNDAATGMRSGVSRFKLAA